MKSLLASPDFASELLGQDTGGQLNKSILLIGGSNINPMSAPASGQETQSMHDWVRTVRTESPPENWRLICKAGRPKTVEAAAAEVTGEGFLQISPVHPGDHKRLSISVALATVDDVIASRGWPEVSLIKVDVQGAEARVLAGAQKTIQRFDQRSLLK